MEHYSWSTGPHSFFPCKEEGLAEHGFGSVLSVLPPLGNEWPEETLVPMVSMGMCPAGMVEEEEAFLDPAAAADWWTPLPNPGLQY